MADGTASNPTLPLPSPRVASLEESEAMAGDRKETLRKRTGGLSGADLVSRTEAKKPRYRQPRIRNCSVYDLWRLLLKVLKRENFLGSDIEICTFS